jgi:hypothetical protein
MVKCGKRQGKEEAKEGSKSSWAGPFLAAHLFPLSLFPSAAQQPLPPPFPPRGPRQPSSCRAQSSRPSARNLSLAQPTSVLPLPSLTNRTHLSSPSSRTPVPATAAPLHGRDLRLFPAATIPRDPWPCPSYSPTPPLGPTSSHQRRPKTLVAPAALPLLGAEPPPPRARRSTAL